MELEKLKAKIRVLLVDDEEEFVKIIKRRLELRSIVVETALDGNQALKLVVEFAPHVMILDLKMPYMDGLEVLKRTKEMAPDLPVIILTGHGNTEDEKEAYRLGCYDFLRKPAEIDMLLNRIHKAYLEINQLNCKANLNSNVKEACQ